MSAEEREKPNHVPSALFEVSSRAQQLFNYWMITLRLELSEQEERLALLYTTERFMRNRVYETSSILKHPLAAIEAAGKFLGGLASAERLHNGRKEALLYLQGEIDAKIEVGFSTPEARHRARTIELAINSLVAEATPQGKTDKIVENMSLSDDQLTSWGQRWAQQLARSAA